MNYRVLSLPAANSTEHLQALAEVDDFATTHMGHTDAGPWTYRRLQEPKLTTELIRLANARSHPYVDSVTFQPCMSSHSQDRYAVEEWDLPGGRWIFNAVFDGHFNHHTVEYAFRQLPSMIKHPLQTALQGKSGGSLPPDLVSRILHDAIANLDNSIRSRFLDLFPRDLSQFNNLSDSAIKGIVHGGSSGSRNLATILRSIGGTTVLVSLTDPLKKNLWIANLGDSYAALGTRSQSGRWVATPLNALHNGNNPSEVRRVKTEHPGENESIQYNRVVGFLEPTRAIGDVWLKIPSVYTRRVLSFLGGEWMSPQKANEYAARIRTPPYVSNKPDVYHRVLPNSPSFLILCSDGLPDLYDEMGPSELVNRWVGIVGRSWEAQGPQRNAALSLLRDAIGGDDASTVSQNMTVEMDERWMDDTTVIVQRFQ